MDFNDIHMIPNMMAKQAFDQGVIEGQTKVDQNVYNQAFQEGFNVKNKYFQIGQLIGVIEGECQMMLKLGGDKQRIIIEQIQQKCKEIDDTKLESATKLIELKVKLRMIKRQLGLKGGIEFKKAQNIDF